MTTASLVKAELERLSRKGSRFEAPEAVTIEAAGGRLRIELDQVDGIGCSLRQLGLQTKRLADAEPTRLRELADHLADQVNYLLEPLSVCEIDAESASAQIRSTPPHREGRQVGYYEILVQRGGQVRLCRYEAAAGEPRRPVPGLLTREVVARLASDIVAAVEEHFAAAPAGART